MKFVAVIPARYGSSRFPGKPLAPILGKPMIQHVYERAKQSKLIDEVIVATDHEEISKVVEGFGGKAVMTSTTHETGSDRIQEVASKVDGDFFLTIQGDEPLIKPELIDLLISHAKESSDAVITAKVEIKSNDDKSDSNIVKVVTDINDFALYFSRSNIPFNRSGLDTAKSYKHLGIYGYPKNVLEEFVQLPQSPMEELEMLEQLRLLENGFKIKVFETTYEAVGVDTPEDIAKVETILGGKQS